MNLDLLNNDDWWHDLPNSVYIVKDTPDGVAITNQNNKEESYTLTDITQIASRIDIRELDETIFVDLLRERLSNTLFAQGEVVEIVRQRLYSPLPRPNFEISNYLDQLMFNDIQHERRLGGKGDLYVTIFRGNEKEKKNLKEKTLQKT